MNKKGIAPLILAGLLIVGIIVFAPALATLTGEAPSCLTYPNNFRCYCPSGYVKQGFFPWRCEKLPDAPDEVTFPIETWEEARAYTESLLGGFPCTGEYQYDTLLSGKIYKQCDKYGSVITDDNTYLGHMVLMECKSIETVNEEGIPTGGYIVFDVRFDPNDGHVYQINCKDDMIPCPEITFRFGENMKGNPLPTCGDGCCHAGESFETCASDCEEIIPPQCTADEVNAYITANSYESLCNAVDGEVKTTGVSLYPTCDYKQKICEVNGEEVLRWHINLWGVCGEHQLLRYNQEVVCPVV